MLESFVAGNWMDQFAVLSERLRPRFSRSDIWQRAESYLLGLLSEVGRKNSWQLAESVGAETPHGFQRLLGRATWDADQVRDDLQHYVIEQIGDARGILIVDETGFLKKGDKSAGVSRQYSGTAGRIENCQIGVFLTYRSDRGRCLVDRELYLPRSWTDERNRRLEAGVPDEIQFATKPTLARKMVERALNAGLNAKWVTADEVYGSDSKFRGSLEKRGIGYVVAVSCQQRLFLGGVRDRVDNHALEIPSRLWKKLTCGSGAKGERFYEWAFVRFGIPTDQGLSRGLLIRRSLKNAEDLAYYFTHAKKGTPVAQLAQVAGARWAIEECFEQAKQETGLDEYEVRSWTGWYRHITLSMFAHAFLSSIRAASNPSRPIKKSKPPVT